MSLLSYPRRPSLPNTLLVGLVALLGSNGCAFLDLRVHPPEPHELPALPPMGRGREVLVDIPFVDGRPDRSRCGMQKNGYNMDTASVICEVPPEQWLSHALAQGLQRAGYRVLAPGATPGPTTIRVTGMVQQFFVEPHVGFFLFTPEADIGVRLMVTSGTGLHAERAFYFKAREPALFGTESKFQAAARAATDDAVAGMVQSITQLVDRYPDVGAPSAVVASPVAMASSGEVSR